MKINAILAGIAMSLLLLTLPAAASDYTLGIFGNANEDDTINMQDVTYTELIILEYKDATELADGKYDDRINMQDVTQIELIILGREKEMTFLDIFDEAVTVNKPIKRLVNMGSSGTLVTRMLGARDTLVAIGNYRFSTMPSFFPIIGKLPVVGTDSSNIDYEMILSLKPDAVQTNFELTYSAKVELKRELEEKLPGMPLISLNMRQTEVFPQNVRTYGYIMDREDEAEEVIAWFEGYMNTFKSRTNGLSEDEKPQFYFEPGSTGAGSYYGVASGSSYAQAVLRAGGRNIVDELVGPDDSRYTWAIMVDPEWVIEQQPEYIFRSLWEQQGAGYETDDPSAFAAVRQEILDRPELANVDAVKNKRVYVPYARLMVASPTGIISTAYMAKLLHPDLFTDIDPEAIHQEYVDKFCYIDFDVREHGVYFYPPPEEW
ncbi:ABC transporter substrate-binding protein [Methanococcoides sp.]|uniref:ABC transporter substrate-binding protein n=1 Tax=Methanococcoides sp. TaxID=1966350 RepID=UPI00272E6B86|nr:ABC transporter substrate-binding protein [Methanococcoides sp.]